MTPYRSGLPIDSIAPPDKTDPDLKRRTKVYQSIVGCINWLATCTRPDVSPVLSFLASYSNARSHQHYKSAIHLLKYIYSTADYGISFHSNDSNTLQAFNHFPHHHDKEAYSGATPPAPGNCTTLTAFSDACWGGQVGNAVPNGTELELFKLHSMSGFLICRTGGPLAWKSIRQNQTALSSCEANVPRSYNRSGTALKISTCLTHLSAHSYTTTTRPQSTGLLRAQTKARSTSIFVRTSCENSIKPESQKLLTSQASSMPVTCSLRN